MHEVEEKLKEWEDGWEWEESLRYTTIGSPKQIINDLKSGVYRPNVTQGAKQSAVRKMKVNTKHHNYNIKKDFCGTSFSVCFRKAHPEFEENRQNLASFAVAQMSGQNYQRKKFQMRSAIKIHFNISNQFNFYTLMFDSASFPEKILCFKLII